MYIDDQMKFHELQAMWWMNAATNGHTNKRHITSNGVTLTDEELRDDAMKCSQRHIHLFMECAEFKQENSK